MATGKFRFPNTMQSAIIYADNHTITKLTVTMEGEETASGGNVKLFCGVSNTWNGTYAWEEVASGPVTGYEHTFAASGKFLKWRAAGIDYRITRLQIKVD